MTRIRLVVAFFYLWFLMIIGSLFYWQVILHEKLSQEAVKQHLMRLKILAKRGEILSSSGSPLVTNAPAYLVYVEPKELVDKNSSIEKISSILQIDEASISAKLDTDLLWIPIEHKVNQEKMDSLKALKIKGIGFENESERFYPEGSMSAHLLGFVGSSYDGSPKGYFGLEGYYDRELKGRPGFLQQARSATGKPILAGISQRIGPENGRKLKLHIDRTVQFIIERELHNGIKHYGAKGGSIVVMNPKNGGILAMASEPSYDPKNYSEFPSKWYKNPVVADTYEPGSTFKIIVVAAAIDQKIVKPTTIFPETGPIEVAGNLIRTWNNKYGGELNVTQILEHSSNVGMVQIAQKIGKEKLLSYIKKFGFGEETKIDLDDETSPSIRPADQWKEIDLATASFGQGLAVTPIQMVRAVTSIAAGGRLFQPQVVDKIIAQDGKNIDIKPKIIREVIKNSTARTLTEMMVQAVNKGEAKFSKLKGYRIAGKTGTAQIPVAGHYDTEKTIASFVGFGPADNPMFVMLVTLREPSSSPWGSETAAPLFFTIAKELFAYFSIPPSY